MTVHSQNQPNTEKRILKFLASYPDGPLTVVVGYASVWGLAWLNDNTKGRKVTLLIGDARERFFSKATDGDKENAMKFLERADVSVSNWYRKQRNPSEAHMKAWLIEAATQSAVLTGSANLTKKGIQQNQELMVEASGSDLSYSIGEIKQLKTKSWDCQERLSGYISGIEVKKKEEKDWIEVEREFFKSFLIFLGAKWARVIRKPCQTP